MKRLLVSARVPLAGAPAAVAVVFTAALLVGVPAAYAANTLYVNAATGTDSLTCGASNDPCQTISQAIENANPGDTIEVAVGTYDEVVYIDKSLTLEGAQAGNAGSAARASESPTTESVVTGGTVDVAADNVTIDGFSFGYAGNQIYTDSAKSTIEDNVFSGYQPEGNYDSALGATSAPDAEVVHNYFTSPTASLSGFGGAVVQWSTPGNCSGVDVSDNVFDNADADALADIYFYCQDQSVSTITVSGNKDTIGGDSSFVNFQHIGGSGGEIDVTDNAVTMTPASGSSGIYFATAESGVQTVKVIGNSLTGDPFRALKLSTNAHIEGPISIIGNDFSDGGVGVYVSSGSVGPGGSVTLRANDLSNEAGDIYDSADGVLNVSGVPVDAEDNWWGCNLGPGTPGCSGVSADVTYDPWLVLGISAAPSVLPAGSSSTVTADVTHDSAGLDTSAEGTILDGTIIDFATTFGSLSATSVGTSGGKASVMLTSSTAGTALVSATLDSQTVSTTVTFTPPPTPTNIDQCKKGGWQSFGIFKNQGDCVSFVATVGKNLGSGG